jgi:hypothetical protein
MLHKVTVKQHFCYQVLLQTFDTVCHKWPQKWEFIEWQICHAPAYLAQLMQQVLAKHGIPQVRQPPVSTGMALCDFFFVA